jgi:hypothetical protein
MPGYAGVTSFFTTYFYMTPLALLHAHDRRWIYRFSGTSIMSIPAVALKR